jgi:uncharacterized protein (TIGR02246 family)
MAYDCLNPARELLARMSSGHNLPRAMKRTIMKATPRFLSGMLLAISLGGSTNVEAAPPQVPSPAPVPPERAADEKAVRAATDAFVAAFAKGDAKAIAGLFTEQGEAIDVGGEAIRGREALEAHYASRFEAGPGDKLEASIEVVHFLAPELARQDGRTKLIPVDGGIPTTSRYAATLLKVRGRWLFASIRELEDPAITHHDRLRELEWMVGEWVEETGDAIIETSVAWSEDENFLLRSFDIKVQGKSDLKGTQRIGWDPLTKQVKSWVFDSKGGHGEGYWTRNGEQWVIKTTGVRPDGLTTSATQTLTRLGKDRLLWTSTDRTLGGETRDDAHEVTMVRTPPRPK